MESLVNKDEFIKRCENIWDSGLASPKRLKLMEAWLDAIMRYEGGQTQNFADFLSDEGQRLEGFKSSKVLANDADGYALIQLAAILTHPCQICAEDRKAWWTRPGFCPHREKSQ